MVKVYSIVLCLIVTLNLSGAIPTGCHIKCFFECMFKPKPCKTDQCPCPREDNITESSPLILTSTAMAIAAGNSSGSTTESQLASTSTTTVTTFVSNDKVIPMAVPGIASFIPSMGPKGSSPTTVKPSGLISKLVDSIVDQINSTTSTAMPTTAATIISSPSTVNTTATIASTTNPVNTASGTESITDSSTTQNSVTVSTMNSIETNEVTSSNQSSPGDKTEVTTTEITLHGSQTVKESNMNSTDMTSDIQGSAEAGGAEKVNGTGKTTLTGQVTTQSSMIENSVPDEVNTAKNVSRGTVEVTTTADLLIVTPEKAIATVNSSGDGPDSAQSSSINAGENIVVTTLKPMVESTTATAESEVDQTISTTTVSDDIFTGGSTVTPMNQAEVTEITTQSPETANTEMSNEIVDLTTIAN